MTVDERTSVLAYAGRMTDHLVDELPTTALAVVGAPPVFVDDSGRRRRTLAGVGSAVTALCVLYLCVVVLGVLRGADNPLLGPVGGLLPAAEAPEGAPPAAPPVSAPVVEGPIEDPARTTATGVPSAVVSAPAPESLTGPAAGAVEGAAEVATRPDATDGTRPPRTEQTTGGDRTGGSGTTDLTPTAPGAGGTTPEVPGTGGTGTGGTPPSGATPEGSPPDGTGAGDAGTGEPATGGDTVPPADLPTGSTT